jgi:membrane associated rhomboid family serine protease
MVNKKSKSQTTKQRIKPRYLLIAAATIILGSLIVFLIASAIIVSYIGTTGGMIGGLIIAVLFALVMAYFFLARSRPQNVTGRRR